VRAAWWQEQKDEVMDGFMDSKINFAYDIT
jgi:hypothetical protein